MTRSKIFYIQTVDKVKMRERCEKYFRLKKLSRTLQVQVITVINFATKMTRVRGGEGGAFKSENDESFCVVLR